METADSDDAEVQVGPAVRARLYRQRAAELEAAITESALPMVQAKYRDAADRFLALASAEEGLASRRSHGVTEGGSDLASISLGPLLAFLRAEPASRE